MKYIKIIFFILAVTIFSTSCRDKKRCVETEQKSKVKIISVDGPQQIAVGEKVALAIGVATNKSWCIKGAEAEIFYQGNNILDIKANILYTNTPKNQEKCNCNNDTTIYALVYFTPLDSGIYTFNYENDSLAGLNTIKRYIVKVK